MDAVTLSVNATIRGADAAPAITLVRRVVLGEMRAAIGTGDGCGNVGDDQGHGGDDDERGERRDRGSGEARAGHR